VFFLLLTVILLYRGLFGDAASMLGNPRTDIGTTFLPVYELACNALCSGRFPLWNPYILSGSPMLAALQPALCYPFTHLFTVALVLLRGTIASGLNLAILFHVFLCGLFTYYLVRSYGAGLWAARASGTVYALCATTVLRVYGGHLTIVCSLPWAPLLFLLLPRALTPGKWHWRALMSAVLCLMFFAGQPQFVFYATFRISLAANPAHQKNRFPETVHHTPFQDESEAFRFHAGPLFLYPLF